MAACACNPLSCTPSPPLLEKIADKTLQVWARELNAKWKLLGRKVGPQNPREHTREGLWLAVPPPEGVALCLSDEARSCAKPTAALPHPCARAPDCAWGRFLEYYYW